jgi:hypothetical protein
MNIKGKSEPHNKATMAMRDAAITLILRRMLKDALTFCTFE